MGKSSSNTEKVHIVQYRMSLHYGICHGPVDMLRKITIKEKVAFETGLVGEGEIGMSDLELFGGVKKEGGIQGFVHFFEGNETQVLPEELAARLKDPGTGEPLTSATAPAYRGICSAWFFHRDVSAGWGDDGATGDLKGFMWTMNNPYLPSTEIQVSRKPRGMSEHLAYIDNPAGPGKYPDANPAIIIYECLTNADWGMGAASDLVDETSFQEVAETLFNEQFGLSMMWAQQAKIEDFVTEVLDHIQATLFVDPATGKFTLRLIRDDYDQDELRTLDPSNSKLTSWSRKAWGETVNEIVVTWTNPENEQDETITFQDLANIAMQGSVVSDSRNYYGIRNADLAAEAAVRDLRTASAPLVSAEIMVNRKGWNLRPGDVVKLTWPEYGFEEIIMRCGKIDYGRPGEMAIKVSLMEDIFSLGLGQFFSPPSTAWEDPALAPEGMLFSRTINLPASILQTFGADFTQDTYPINTLAILAVGNADTASYELSGTTTLPNGDEAWEDINTMYPVGHATLVAPLAREAVSTITGLANRTGPMSLSVAGFLLIGEDEETMEVVMIDAISSGVMTLARGVYDTVPRAWPAGTPVWIIDNSFASIDVTEHSVGEVVEYKLQARTSKGLMPFDDAPILEGEVTDRPYLPYRPANVKVNGVGFGPAVYTTTPTTIPVTWSNRNRLLEDALVRRWTEAGMVPETGQTTTIRIFDTEDNLLTTHAGLAGESFDVPLASFSGAGETRVRVSSVRDGFESLMGYMISVEIPNLPGYGNNYGNVYGGTA